MVVWRRANIMLANIIHGDPSHESTPLPRRPRRGGLYFCVKRAKNKGRVLSAAPSGSECFGQLVTGDGGASGPQVGDPNYLIHSNRFCSKGKSGRVDDAAHHDRHAIKRHPPEYEAIAPAWDCLLYTSPSP